MERRKFVAAFATTAAGLAANPLGAAPPMPAEVPMLPPPPDMEEYLTRVDQGLARIGGWSPTAGVTSFHGDRAATDALARKSLQAVFLTGMLGDLPIPSQLHPGMQDRMWDATPLFDEAADGMTAYIGSRTQEDLARVQSALRTPGTAQRVIDSLAAEADRTGVSAPRRAQLREMLQHVTWRLAHQPPSLLVGEYLEKVEKVADTDVEAEARQRQLAAQVGEEVFWKGDERTKRQRRISRGMKTMGIGLLVTAAGTGVAAAGAMPGVFVMTVGVVMMLVGLVILLMGAMTSDPKPEPTTTAQSDK